MNRAAIVKFGVFLLFLIVMATVIWQTDISTKEFVLNIRELNGQNPWFAFLGFIGVYIAASLVFLPASPLTAVAGALFGPFWGTVLSVIGATLGAFAAFGIARFLGEPFVRALLEDKLRTVYTYDQKLARNGFLTVLILRLVPVIPFNGLNFALGVTRVKSFDYFFATLVGIIPGAFVFALGGESLAMLDMLNFVIALLLFGALTAFAYKIKTSRIMDTDRTETAEKSSSMTQKGDVYDVIVIGAGAAGLNIASVMNEMGFRVLLIEKSAEQIGGDCLNDGCVPSKALLHAAQAVHTARTEGTKFGLDVRGEVDMRTVRAYITEVQDQIREEENVQYLRDKGIEVVLGEAAFSGKDRVRVNTEEYRGRRIVLATGSRPRVISIPGDEQVTIRTNETIFDLETLPDRFVVLGAGPVGVEIAQAFRYLGSKVTVVDMGERILASEAPDISDLMRRRLEEQGITFYLGYTAKEFSSSNTLVLEDKAGEHVTLEFDEFLMAVGRDTTLDPKLNPRAAHITSYDGHVAVDDRLQTRNPRVIVCGDASGGLLFTHTTEQQSSVIVRNFFTPFKSSWNTDHMAWVTYTDPEIATFGLSEETLLERRIPYQVVAEDIPSADRTLTDNYPVGKVKYYLSRGKILGGTVMAPRAGEIIQELILANTYGLSVDKVFNKVYPYPTASRVTKHALLPYFRAKLTRRTRSVLHWLFRLFN